VMCENKRPHVIRRIVTPPTLPTMVGPRAAERAKHVSAEYPGAFAAHALFGKTVVDAGLAALATMHRLKRNGRKKPLHELGTGRPERIFKGLIRPGGKAVKGYTDRLDYYFRHNR